MDSGEAVGDAGDSSRSILGSEVGLLEEFCEKDLTGISRDFDRKMHVLLIISIRHSYDIPEPIL
jgi:hypothetical protein